MLKWLTKQRGKSVRTQRVVVRRQATEIIAVPVAKAHATSHRSTATAVIPNAPEISNDEGARPAISPHLIYGHVRAWANGSFYLLTFAVVIAGLGVLANTVPWYALAAILIAGILFVPLIGFLQLRQDERLSEKSFTELMKLVVGQLPLIKNLTGQAKQLPEAEWPSDRALPPESH